MSELHISVVGQTFSFRPDGAPLEERSSIFSAFRYGSSPDAVLITYGIQGEGYFKDFAAHFETCLAGCRAIMGYVWPRHVPIYARMVKRKGWSFREMWRGKPYGEDGPEFSWIVGERRPTESPSKAPCAGGEGEG